MHSSFQYFVVKTNQPDKNKHKIEINKKKQKTKNHTLTHKYTQTRALKFRSIQNKYICISLSLHLNIRHIETKLYELCYNNRNKQSKQTIETKSPTL